jgi:uncharacterized protein
MAVASASSKTAPPSAEQRRLNRELLRAIEDRDLSLARDLIAQGARGDSPGNGHFGPLSLSAHRNDFEAVELLLPVSDINETDAAVMRTTPLMAATSKGFSRMVKLLLARGADARFTNARGSTALIIAASNCNTPCLRQLVAFSDANAVDNDGFSALFFLAMSATSAAKLRAIKVLLPFCDAAAQNAAGLTALMAAASRGNEAACRLLASVGDVAARDVNGRAAEDFARDTGHRDLAQELTAIRERANLAAEVASASLAPSAPTASKPRARRV